jgi:hypothetical protein
LLEKKNNEKNLKYVAAQENGVTSPISRQKIGLEEVPFQEQLDSRIM